MKITEISLGQSFEDGIVRWQKPEIKATPEPGETPHQVLDQIKEIIDSWQAKSNPGLYPSSFGMHRVTPTTSPGETVLEGINSCTDITVLKSYYLIARQDPDTLSAYTKKYEQLTAKK